jgi:DNA-binding NtrC family response regulator
MAKILVADDEAGVREFVERALATKGHVVTAVSDGSEALMALARSDFDILLTDIRMPVMDGVELALAVTKNHPTMPILMMTGFADERERAYNLDQLICDVVAKPFDLATICSKIEKALAAASKS